MIKVLKQTLVLHNSLFFMQFMISFGFKILLNHCWLLDAYMSPQKPWKKLRVELKILPAWNIVNGIVLIPGKISVRLGCI